MKAKEKSNMIKVYKILIVIFVAKCISVFSKGQFLKQEGIWSTTDVESDSIIHISRENPSIKQNFINQYKNLEQCTIIFSQCQSMKSGIVKVNLEDLEGNVYYEYEFEPRYLNQNEFCLMGNMKTKLSAGKEYSLHISVEGIGEDEFIGIKATTNLSKVKVFKPVDADKALFIRLSYCYVDIKYLLTEFRNIFAAFIMVLSCMVVSLHNKVMFGLISKYSRGFVVALILIMILLVIAVSTKINDDKKLWYNRYKYVAHAMGEIDGKSYTNSLEAFKKAYGGV